MNNITNPKEADCTLKQENDDKAKASSSSSSAAQWLRLKDPRIVRVSRAFGGKDRHSKVCTVRGLRDRRVRLSVPTAIQLYDLQDRLGFNQPSKVVDWLLNAAKHEIGELPPLQIPPGNFSLGLCHLSPKNSNNNQVSTSQPNEEGEFNRREEDRDNLLSRANNINHPSFQGLIDTMPLGYNINNNQWEPNSSDASHSVFANQTDLQSINAVPFSTSSSSTLSLSTQSYLPLHIAAMDMDQRQINHYQMLSSSTSQNPLTNSLMSPSSLYHMSQSVKPFSLSMTPKLLHSPNSSESQCHTKDQDFPSKSYTNKHGRP